MTDTEIAKAGAAAVAEQPPIKPEIKQEDEQAVRDMLGRFTNGTSQKLNKVEDKPADEPVLETTQTPEGKAAAEAKAAAEKSAATAKPKSAKKKAVAAPAKSSEPPRDLAAEIARGVAEGLKVKEPEKKAAELDTTGWNEEEIADLPVFQQMEKSDPKKYKGLTDKVAASIRAAQAYEDKWQEANPGKEFNPDDDEHAAFVKKNSVAYSDRDFDDARVDLRLEPVKEKLAKETTEKIATLEARDRAREVEPLAMSDSKKRSFSLFTGVGSGFEKVLDNNGTVNQPAIAALYADDPTKAGIVFGAAHRLEEMAAENVRLHSAAKPYDQNNPVHAELGRYATAMEQSMEQMGFEEKKNQEGKMFAPSAEYYKMSKSDRAKHWTFSAADINILLANDTLTQVKQQLDADDKRVEALIAKRGYKKAEGTETEEAARVAAKAANGRVDKPISPTTGESVKVSSQRGNGAADSGDGVNGFYNRFFRGR